MATRRAGTDSTPRSRSARPCATISWPGRPSNRISGSLYGDVTPVPTVLIGRGLLPGQQVLEAVALVGGHEHLRAPPADLFRPDAARLVEQHALRGGDLL